jgi:hypothetical protein
MEDEPDADPADDGGNAADPPLVPESPSQSSRSATPLLAANMKAERKRRTPAEMRRPARASAATAESDDEQEQQSAHAAYIASTKPPKMAPAVAALMKDRATISACHMCKAPKQQSKMRQCHAFLRGLERVDARGRRLPPCRKRFCEGCARKHLGIDVYDRVAEQTWTCPACENTCPCASCVVVRAGVAGKSAEGAPTAAPVIPRKFKAPRAKFYGTKASRRVSDAAAQLPPLHQSQQQLQQPLPPRVDRSHMQRQAAANALALATRQMALSSQAQAQAQLLQSRAHQALPQQSAPSLPTPTAPPTELLLSCGQECEREVGPQETHVLVARVCVPHSLGVTVRTPASADGSVASSFTVFFPTVGVPLFVPARARYKLANLALDDPLIREIQPSASSADATGDGMELEHKSGATNFEHVTTPGPLVVLDVFVMDHNETAFPQSKQPAHLQHAQQFGEPTQSTPSHAASSDVTAAQRAQQERADRALQLRLQEEEHQAAAAAGYGSGDDGDDGAGGGGGSDAGASEQFAAPRRRISAREANEREDFAPVVRPKRKYVRSAPLSGGSATPNAKRARMHAALLSNAAAMGQSAAAATQKLPEVVPSGSASSASHSDVVPPPAQDVPSHSAQPREDDGDDGKSAGGD